ncbi:hypothetical protein D3C76_1790500 [compost metagenome]
MKLLAGYLRSEIVLVLGKTRKIFAEFLKYMAREGRAVKGFGFLIWSRTELIGNAEKLFGIGDEACGI